MLDWAMDHIWITMGTVAVALVALMVWAASSELKYIEAHDCQQTGQTRIGSIMNTGGSMLVPIYENEYRCQGGETRWFTTTR